jgi:hypothetical protein
MSYREKQSIVSILGTILIFAGYCWYVFGKYQDGSVNLTDDLRFWGIVILIFVPVSVAVRIVIEIVFNIVNTVINTAVAGEEVEEEPTFADERDKLIELKGLRLGYLVVGIGFLLSMASLVLEHPPFIMLNIIFCSFSVAQIVEDVAKLYFYQRGF